MKLHTENQHTRLLNYGESYEGDLESGFGRRPQSIFSLSIYLLIGLISDYIPKITLIACLILEIGMKKTLKLGFGRRPLHNFIFFF